MAPKEITDFTGFRTSIRQLFEVLQNAYDKEKMQEVLQNDEKFSKVDRETVEAINLFAGTDIDIDEKEEVIDMCKAWEEQKNEGRELGREEGRELGERQKIISLIVKKLQKDKSVAEIADDLEAVSYTHLANRLIASTVSLSTLLNFSSFCSTACSFARY